MDFFYHINKAILLLFGAPEKWAESQPGTAGSSPCSNMVNAYVDL